MVRNNSKQLVEMSVQGKVANPYHRGMFFVDDKGAPFALPGTGGITYNVKVGDSAFGWAGDHIEPAVSTCANEEERTGFVNSAYNFYACIGNEAIIVNGPAHGKKGVVTGHHGGIEHVIIDFSDETMNKMDLDTKILIRAIGQGLELLDYPEIKVTNIDPKLFKKMGIRENKNIEGISVPVTHVIPGKLMGSGIGSITPHKGDYDIMTQDMTMVKAYDLESMRFGDIVAILDHDNSYGRNYQSGAITIGVVIHSDCLKAGHGPGVCGILTCRTSKIQPVKKKTANIGRYLGIGRHRNVRGRKRT